MHEEIKRWIPMSECRDGYVYRIAARCGGFGVYNVEKKCFSLSRHKFGSNFIDDEYHWDTGEPHGTVKPLEDYGKFTGLKHEEYLLPYLNVLEEEMGTGQNY
jgi:hypothetical protein